MPSFAARASRRDQLQRALGELGEILPRIARGDSKHPAAGWYARIKETDVYLGDHAGVAFITIARLLDETP